MNEEALKVLYGLAQGDGYKKSFDEFTLLMSDNEDAVNTMFGLAQQDGYTKNMDDFKTLVGYGVKKKENEEVTASVSEDGLSEPQEIDASAFEVQTSADMQSEDLPFTNRAIETSRVFAEAYPEDVDPQLVSVGDENQYLIPSLFPIEGGGYEALQGQEAIDRAKELDLIKYMGEPGESPDTTSVNQILEGDFRRIAQLDTDTYEGTLFDRERQGEGFDRFTDALSEVNADLIDFEEEYVVPKMNYLFNGLRISVRRDRNRRRYDCDR